MEPAREPGPPGRRRPWLPAVLWAAGGGLGLLALGVLLRALLSAGALPRADFAFVSGGELTSLDPHTVTGIPEGRVLRALYEGLVGRDPRTLEPVPAAAESWEVSSDGREYLFHLREGARWSNGDPLTAHDFEWSLRRILEPSTAAPYASELWAVRGARAFSTGSSSDGAAAPRDWSEVGVRALDELTLRIELERPLPYLLQLLAFHAFFPVHRASLEQLQQRFPDSWRTRWGRPENLVVNGPFALDLRRLDDRIRLKKSPLYWDADAVAFETIDARSLERAGTALNLYLSGEVDWLDGAIPPLLVPRVRSREDFLRTRYLGVYFYRVNTTKPPLDDPRVRRALSAAIPRREICDKLLQAGQQPATTLVPWGGVGDYRSPPGLSEDLAAARAGLAEAGFGPEGAEFPAIEIHYNTAESHRDIAEVIATAWRRELGLDVRLANQEWKAYLDTQESLSYDVSRSSWIADYPDALGFLRIFTSASENNKTGFSDAEFDRLVAEGEQAVDPAERAATLALAEARLLELMPVLPIYSYVTQNLVDPRLGGFHANLLNEHSPKHWYWKSAAELASERGNAPTFYPRRGSQVPRGGRYSPAALRERAEAPPSGGDG